MSAASTVAAAGTRASRRRVKEVRSKNPFFGTHTKRLLKQTQEKVEYELTRTGSRKKNIFDIARAHRDLVGRKVQHMSWSQHLEEDQANPQYYWKITEIRFRENHPTARTGSAYGIKYWKGVPYIPVKSGEGEVRRIKGAAVKKWRLCEEPEEYDLGKPRLVLPKVEVEAVPEEVEEEEEE